MELSQIRYFVVLARTLHFTRAAEACHVSQPALTKAIQKLEDELGGALFHRERSHTQLTELGRLMLPPLERAFDSARDAKTQAEAFRRRESSPLRIGLEYSVSSAVLTPVLASLRRHFTDLELSMHQGPQTALCERMLAGELDLGLFVERPDLPERLHRWRLFAERYVLICPPGHRFGECETVSVADLAGESLLLLDDARCPLRRFLLDLCEAAGVRPRRQHFASSQQQIIDMVLASLGVSVVGERVPLAAPLLHRPMRCDPDRRDIIVAALAGRPLGPTPALFLKLMRGRAWALDGEPAVAVAA